MIALNFVDKFEKYEQQMVFFFYKYLFFFFWLKIYILLTVNNEYDLLDINIMNC